MSIEQTLINMKNKVDSAKQQKQEAETMYKVLLGQLKDDYGYDSVSEAVKAHTEEGNALATRKQEILDSISKLEADYDF